MFAHLFFSSVFFFPCPLQYAAKVSREAADQVNIEVLAQIDLVPATGCLTSATCPTLDCAQPANCPTIAPANLYQSFVWPDGKTALDIALELKALNPDVIQVLIGTNSGSWSLAQLLAAMEEVDWAPKAINWCANEQDTESTQCDRAGQFDGGRSEDDPRLIAFAVAFLSAPLLVFCCPGPVRIAAWIHFW
jgi:hypothetical protein